MIIYLFEKEIETSRKKIGDLNLWWREITFFRENYHELELIPTYGATARYELEIKDKVVKLCIAMVKPHF